MTVTAKTEKKTPVDPNAETIYSSRPDFDLEDIYDLRVGKMSVPATYRKSLSRRAKIERQTYAMAKKLEEAGIHARSAPKAEQNSDGSWSGLVLLTNVTRQAIPVETWRNINLLPQVAIRNRRRMELDLQAYLQRDENQHARFYVITSGQRSAIKFNPEDPDDDNFHREYRDLRRRMNNWMKFVCTKEGVFVDFIGLEFPRGKDRSYHLHANVVLRMPKMSSEELKSFKARSKMTLRTEAFDAGGVEDVSKFVRYPFKANEIDNIDADEAGWLFRNTHGKRIVQAVGQFKAFRKHLNENGMKTARLGKHVYIRSKSDLFFPMKRPKQAAAAEKFEGEEATLSTAPEDQSYSVVNRSCENILISRTAPAALASPVNEGGVFVLNYTPNATDEKSAQRLMEMREYRVRDEARWKQMQAPSPAEAMALHDLVEQVDWHDLYDEIGNKIDYKHLIRKFCDTYANLLKARRDQLLVHNVTITGNENNSFSNHDQEAIEDPPDPPIGSFLDVFEGTYISPSELEIDAAHESYCNTILEHEDACPDFLAIFDEDGPETKKFYFQGELLQRDVVEDCLQIIDHAGA